MDTYSLLRQFADSWMLLLLTAVFVGVILWAWRPGSRKLHEETSRMIFRNDDRPAAGTAGTPRKGAPLEEAWK